MNLRSRSLLVASTIAVALLTGCASSSNSDVASSEGALSGDEGGPAMGLLLRCDGASDTTAELSIEKDSQGSRITLLVQPLKGFFTVEYRGSDVGSVRDLGAGRQATFAAEHLSELGRRDLITVRPSGSSAKLTVESAQHGALEFSCTFVD